MSCDVGEVTESLENEQASPMSQDFHLRHLVSCPCSKDVDGCPQRNLEQCAENLWNSMIMVEMTFLQEY